MKVSVIIPVYNQKHRLKLVLKAFNNQCYDKWYEIIVVDDGSTDNVEEFISDLELYMDFTYKRLDKNSGRSISRNEGVRCSKGDILIFCDADRIPDENFISEHVKSHLSCNDDKVVIGKIVEIFLNKFEEQYYKYFSIDKLTTFLKFARNFNFYDYIIEIYDFDGRTNAQIAWCSLFTGNFSISKKLFLKNRGFDDEFSLWGFENFEFGYRLSRMNVKYILNRKAENFHIFHQADRNGSMRDKSFELFIKKHPYPEVKNILKVLDGEISWQRLNAIAEGLTEERINIETFFNPGVLGKRYRMGV